MNGLPSLHDDFLVSYEVNCEARQIKLRAKPDAKEEAKRGLPARTIVFEGVEGYQFEGDAFGNIILSLDEISVEGLLNAYGAQVAESYRASGAPGPRAHDLASATRSLTAKGVRGFILSSSYGLSGWVLATQVSVVEQS